MINEIKEIYAEIENMPRLAHVVVNKKCNLQCQHCDWPEKFSVEEKEISEKEWKKFAHSFSGMGGKMIAICGREPFLTKASRSKVAAIATQAVIDKMAIGVITNGHFIEKFISEHTGIRFDYLDISLEGPEDINDIVRGKGSFRKAIQGLELAVKNNIAEKVFISLTLTNLNIGRLEEFVKEISNPGCGNFVFHTLVPGEYVNSDLKLSDDDFLNLIPRFESLAGIMEELIVDIYPPSFENFENVISKILPDIDVFLEDNNYLVARYKNSKLYFRFLNLISAIANAIFVAPEGFVITPTAMRKKNYLAQILADTRDVSEWKQNPNIREITRLSLKINNECVNKKCFVFCLGQNKNCPEITKGGD